MVPHNHPRLWLLLSTYFPTPRISGGPPPLSGKRGKEDPGESCGAALHTPHHCGFRTLSWGPYNWKEAGKESCILWKGKKQGLVNIPGATASLRCPSEISIKTAKCSTLSYGELRLHKGTTHCPASAQNLESQENMESLKILTGLSTNRPDLIFADWH